MKLCFSTLGCPDWDITQVAQNAAAYGFDGVELRIRDDRHVDPALTKNERAHIKDMFAARGVDIPIISGYTTFYGSDPTRLKENEDKLIINAELAADLGVKYVRTFIGELGAFTEVGAQYLHAAGNRAAALGVTVLVEIHDVINSGKKAAELIDMVNSPGVAILWDIHHSLRDGESPQDTWRHVGAHIRHVHIKDADAAHNLCLMGEGVLPVPAIIKLLAEKNFDGFLSFEWEKMWVPSLPNPEIALPHYLAYMRELVKAAR
ncbi:MAG: sugar phosphate isomerase/epimerase [Defluviitaleaceae bacterium]|nr:sugar phosphate isomerase/epimerase [Defluviitaleaceae bacterium]